MKERFTLPMAEHRFTPEELERCATGECVQCGRCCDMSQGFVVPSLQGTFRLKLGRSCVLSMRNADGRHSCVAHTEKITNPYLKACKEFNGTEGGYDSIVELTRACVIAPVTREDVEQVEDYLRRGLLSDISCFLYEASDVIAMLYAYVHRLDIFDIALFEAFGLPQALDRYDTNDKRYILEKAGIPFADVHQLNTAEQKLLQQWMPNLMGDKQKSSALHSQLVTDILYNSKRSAKNHTRY